MTASSLFNVKDPQGNIYGPADIPTLRQWIKEGRILGTMQIAPEGTEAWQPTATYPGLADLFAQPASPAAPANQGYGQPNPYSGQPRYVPITPTTTSTNGMAIASLVCSLVGCSVCCLGYILGIIFGMMAKKQIAESEGRQTGEGLATAGIIIGIIGMILSTIVLILYVVLVASGEIR